MLYLKDHWNFYTVVILSHYYEIRRNLNPKSKTSKQLRYQDDIICGCLRLYRTHLFQITNVFAFDAVTTNALWSVVTILNENYSVIFAVCDSVWKRECVKKEELHENRKKKQLTRMERRSNAGEWEEEEKEKI